MQHTKFKRQRNSQGAQNIPSEEEHCCCHDISAKTNTSKWDFTVEIFVASGGQSETSSGGAVGTHWALA